MTADTPSCDETPGRKQQIGTASTRQARDGVWFPATSKHYEGGTSPCVKCEFCSKNRTRDHATAVGVTSPQNAHKMVQWSPGLPRPLRCGVRLRTTLSPIPDSRLTGYYDLRANCYTPGECVRSRRDPLSIPLAPAFPVRLRESGPCGRGADAAGGVVLGIGRARAGKT